MLKYLKELCSLNAPSGHEKEVFEYIRAIALKYSSKVYRDALGNLIVFKKGKSSFDKTIMIAAHMDEVGLIIKKICSDGTLKFGFVGGVDPRVAIGRRVIIGDKCVNGVIGIKAVHLTTREERQKIPDTDSLYIDIGATDAASAERMINIGDYAVFESEFRMLSDRIIKARAIDDRAGCAIMLKLLEQEPAYDTWFAFTVQEEVGLRGAAAAAYHIKPDIALILETTTAADIPSAYDHKAVCRVGNGAVISYMDCTAIYDRQLFLDMTSAADRLAIKWQTKSMVSGGNDAGAIHKTASGAACINISVPVRYIHSQSSIASIDDCQSALRLSRVFFDILK